MEPPRQSSQPATVDLVRADLAEMWTIDLPESNSQRTPAPLFDASDLDLEPVQTPRFRPSKSKTRDTLADMLAGVLDPTPKRTKGTDNRHRAGHADNGSSEASADEDPVTVASPVHSTVPKPHRQRKLNIKIVAPSAAGKNRAKRVQQAGPPPTPVKPSSTRTKTKARKRDDDVFELSDSTDMEPEAVKPKPRKRQAKGAAPAESRVALQSNRPIVDSEVGRANRSRKSPRLLKKPAGLPILGELEVEIQQGDCETSVGAGRKSELQVGPSRHHKNTSSMSKPDSDEGWQMDSPALLSQFASIPEETASSDPPRPSTTLPRENETARLIPPETGEIIMLSSESGKAGDNAPRSTSPLFLEQNQGYMVTSDGSDAPETIEPGFRANPGWPIRDTTELELAPRPSFTSPPSFQHRSLRSAVGIQQKHNMTHPLPTGKSGFISDEQPDQVSPSLMHREALCSDNDRLSPENMWKQAVEDNYPPAVLHRIVSLLHRSLKPREEVIQDIANDYRENALRLLENLSTRHIQEKADTLTAVRKASGAAFSVFSDAGHDMRILSSRLREMDVTDTETILKRPALTQKLDVVARLSHTKLSKNVQCGVFPGVAPLGDESASESEIVNGKIDTLVDTYRLKLCGALGQDNDQTFETYERMKSEVDKFITRCVQGESGVVPRPEPKKKDTSNRTADEELEAFLDQIIDNLQDGDDARGFGQAANDVEGHIIDVVAENMGMSDLEMSG